MVGPWFGKIGCYRKFALAYMMMNMLMGKGGTSNGRVELHLSVIYPQPTRNIGKSSQTKTARVTMQRQTEGTWGPLKARKKSVKVKTDRMKQRRTIE